MSTTIIVIVAALIVLGVLAAGIAASVLRAWTTAVLAGGGFSVRPLSTEQLDPFLADATFTVTARRQFPFPPHQVWDALQLDGTFSWIPLVNGIRYRDDHRREGAARSFDGLLFACAEKVVTVAQDKRLSVTGTRISIPFLIDAFAQDYRLDEADGGTILSWTIAFRPRVGGSLPLRWAAPFVKPVMTLSIKGLASRI
ncbi:SRPBCC family protein [Nocardia sp. CDC160]|uniref:SRPBCC family protein n=1 Tax=Nocardia sp. CDC160 TaxID=3112166 RepID=UPI002DB98FBF|nr:SRPBCC family protein [Nocardia sp. CDC160]MEC3914625.1 SRPBCC family protein [Nocardia sp. CDC160]